MVDICEGLRPDRSTMLHRCCRECFLLRLNRLMLQVNATICIVVRGFVQISWPSRKRDWRGAEVDGSSSSSQLAWYRRLPALPSLRFLHHIRLILPSIPLTLTHWTGIESSLKTFCRLSSHVELTVPAPAGRFFHSSCRSHPIDLEEFEEPVTMCRWR